MQEMMYKLMNGYVDNKISLFLMTEENFIIEMKSKK